MAFFSVPRFFLIALAMAATVTSMAEEGKLAPTTPQKAVLVTGASSGIGRKITEVLAHQGYFVYAGARKEADLIALNKIPNVQSVRLDVTVQADIDAAVKTITEGGRGLYGLVNNAGVGLWGPLNETTEEDFHFLMNVNLYGPYRMTKAFSPLIINAQGRIVMIGSLMGTTTMQMMGPYAMSKHAMEAFTDTLAAEMSPYGVGVSIVEPGTYNTLINKNTYDRAQALLKASPDDELAQWQKEFLAKGSGLHDKYPPPDKVAHAVSEALFGKDPKRRYLAVPEQEQAESTVKAAMRRAVQLNNGSEYSLDREAMVKMLNETIHNQQRVRIKQ